jgi:prepilin-type N-terminal cleavage/methylation domain-containing protein
MHYKKAFSLVEISIVMIILGLLVTGVTAGTSLIKQAKLRTIMNEVQMIERSIKTFYIAYDALAGDFEYAGSFWGAACGGNSPAPAGCNGDGDGVIESFSTGESFRFWQHLQLGEIISNKTFTGVSATISGVEPWHSKDNSYESRYASDLLYQITYVASYWSDYGIRNNLIRLGRNDNGSNYNSGGGSFIAKDVHAIDKKFDDGKPLLGFVQGHIAYLGSAGWDTKICSVLIGNIETAYYPLDREDTACQIIFAGNKIFEF